MAENKLNTGSILLRQLTCGAVVYGKVTKQGVVNSFGEPLFQVRPFMEEALTNDTGEDLTWLALRLLNVVVETEEDILKKWQLT